MTGESLPVVLRLRAELDRLEAIAQAADAGVRWSARIPTDGPLVYIGEEVAWSREIDYAVWRCEDEQDGCPDIARGYAAEARHIAANDPAHVLRTIQAHRKIVDRHRPVRFQGPPICMQCSAKRWPCDDVLALASIYFPESDATDGP